MRDLCRMRKRGREPGDDPLPKSTRVRWVQTKAVFVYVCPSMVAQCVSKRESDRRAHMQCCCARMQCRCVLLRFMFSDIRHHVFRSGNQSCAGQTSPAALQMQLHPLRRLHPQPMQARAGCKLICRLVAKGSCLSPEKFWVNKGRVNKGPCIRKSLYGD